MDLDSSIAQALSAIDVSPLKREVVLTGAMHLQLLLNEFPFYGSWRVVLQPSEPALPLGDNSDCSVLQT